MNNDIRPATSSANRGMLAIASHIRRAPSVEHVTLDPCLMRFLKALAVLIGVALCFTSCAGSRALVAAPEKPAVRNGVGVSARAVRSTPDHAFFVGSRGWHSSITVERAAIPRGTWPAGVAERAFAGSRYVEVGWGDADFYMARRPTVLTALDALLLPGASVLLVVGLDAPLDRALPWGGLQRVPCSREEFAALCRAIGATFQRNENGKAESVGKGLYGRESRFYAARGRYSAVQTCNHWTTRMMRAGGLRASLAPTETWTSGAVVRQARRLANQRAAQAALR